MGLELTAEVGDPHRWLALILFSLYSASNAIQWITYASIASSVISLFNLTTNELNMLSSVYMIIFAAGAYLTCTTFESFGVRTGVIIGCVLNAVGSVLKVAPGLQVRTYTVLIISQTLNSVAQLFVLSTPPLLAAQYFVARRRAFATAIMATANTLGNAVALIVPPFIVTRPEVNQFYILFSLQMGYCVLILIAVVLFLRPPRFQAPSSALLVASGAKEADDDRRARPDEDPEMLDGASVQSARNAAASIQTIEKRAGVMGTDEIAAGMCEPTVTSYELGAHSDGAEEPRGRFRRALANTHVRNFINVGVTVWELLKCRDFVFLLIAFSIGMGSIWTFSSVLAQILAPFGVSEQLAGIAGAANVVAGTILAYIVGLWVDRHRLYKWPVTICLAGSVVCCLGLMVLMLKGPKNTRLFDGLAVFIYAFAGLFQNTAIPIAFEFAMEISYPLQESVPGAMLMAGANIASLIMLSISSAMLGNGEVKPSSCVNVLILITCFTVFGTVMAALPRELLNRSKAEKLAREQVAASKDGALLPESVELEPIEEADVDHEEFVGREGGH